jgi:hypothetical protein
VFTRSWVLDIAVADVPIPDQLLLSDSLCEFNVILGRDFLKNGFSVRLESRLVFFPHISSNVSFVSQNHLNVSEKGDVYVHTELGISPPLKSAVL